MEAELEKTKKQLNTEINKNKTNTEDISKLIVENMLIKLEKFDDDKETNDNIYETLVKIINTENMR